MKKILIIGNKGQLGSEFCQILQSESVDFIGYDLPEFDVSNFDNVAQAIDNYRPNVVINCSAYNFVDLAESEPEKCQRVNATGALNLARMSHKTKSFLVHFSTDYVFDGGKKQPYAETDLPNPLNQYGRSKLLGEELIANETERYLILRTSWLYGKGKQNFIYKFLRWSNEKEVVKIATDEISVPTSVQTVASITLHALRKGLCGLYHLTNSGFASRFEWANLLKEVLNLRVEITPAKMEDFNLPAKRPKFSAMANSKIANELGVSISEWDFELQQQVRKYLDL